MSVYPLYTYRSVQAGVTWCLFGFESQKERKEEKNNSHWHRHSPSTEHTCIFLWGERLHIILQAIFSIISPRWSRKIFFFVCVCVHICEVSYQFTLTVIGAYLGDSNCRTVLFFSLTFKMYPITSLSEQMCLFIVWASRQVNAAYWEEKAMGKMSRTSAFKTIKILK